jgi:hypothetical protein
MKKILEWQIQLQFTVKKTDELYKSYQMRNEINHDFACSTTDLIVMNGVITDKNDVKKE